MRLIIFQSFLFGAASMNAFWHPSPITIGALPFMLLFVVLAFKQTRGEA